MNEAELRLYCTWHVDPAWRKICNLINMNDKQVETYHNLCTLLQETGQAAFLIVRRIFKALRGCSRYLKVKTTIYILMLTPEMQRLQYQF